MKPGFLLLLILCVTVARGATFTVTNAAAFQTALTAAQTNGQQNVIQVAAGTYPISTSLIYSSAEPYSLSILGANTATTVLDGRASVQPMQLASSAGGSVSVAGLTFRNGRNTAGDGIGGGLSIICDGGGVPTVATCVFSNNFAQRTAGGIYVATGTGNATITNCVAARNTTAIDDGGGIYVYKASGGGTILVADNLLFGNHLHSHPSAVGGVEGSALFIYYLGSYCTIIVSNNVMRNNTLESGSGAMYLRATRGAALHLCDNVFSGNVSADDSEVRGGGAHLELETGILRVIGNQFITNRVSGTPNQGDGGGLALTFNTAGAFEMRNNVFVRNQANRHGGGANVNLGNAVTQALIVQNLFVGNHASAEGVGGGLQVNAACDVTLINNTMVGNTAGDAGAFGFYAEAAADAATLCNELYWNNAPNALAVVGAGPIAARYSDLENGAGQSWFGAGCITAQPHFVNAGLDDYHLQGNSPCINSGTNLPWLVGAHDLDGNPRLHDGRVDMGCYELIPEPAALALLAGYLECVHRRSVRFCRSILHVP